MYCPKCGTDISDFPCPVCGALPTTRIQGYASSPVYASLWSRMGSTILDNLILLIPNYAAFLLGDAIANSTVGVLLTIVVWAVYLIVLLSLPNGQTVGNRIVATRVRDAVSGQAITLQQAVRRWIPFALYGSVQFLRAGDSLAYLALFVALADFFYPLLNEKKQTWHDHLAGTVVVRD